MRMAELLLYPVALQAAMGGRHVVHEQLVYWPRPNSSSGSDHALGDFLLLTAAPCCVDRTSIPVTTAVPCEAGAAPGGAALSGGEQHQPHPGAPASAPVPALLLLFSRPYGGAAATASAAGGPSPAAVPYSAQGHGIPQRTSGAVCSPVTVRSDDECTSSSSSLARSSPSRGLAGSLGRAPKPHKPRSRRSPSISGFLASLGRPACLGGGRGPTQTHTHDDGIERAQVLCAAAAAAAAPEEPEAAAAAGGCIPGDGKSSWLGPASLPRRVLSAAGAQRTGAEMCGSEAGRLITGQDISDHTVDSRASVGRASSAAASADAAAAGGVGAARGGVTGALQDLALRMWLDQLLLSHVPCGMTMVTLGGRVVYQNGRCARMTRCPCTVTRTMKYLYHAVRRMTDM